MIVELQTNSENPSLSLSEFRGVGEHIHAAKLRVVSGSYSAEVRFLFDYGFFVNFVDDIRRMDRELHGKARLKEDHSSEPYLALELSHTGAVEVSSVLLDWEHRLQRLEFHFRTDQTVLAPFADDLERARDLQVAAQMDEA